MIDRAEVEKQVDNICGPYATMEAKLEVIMIDLLLEIRDELHKLNHPFFEAKIKDPEKMVGVIGDAL